MITRITGILNRVLDDEVRLQVGGFEYAVLVAEFVRRTVQMKVGQELTLHTNHFLDGNPMQGKVVPRLLGFLHEVDLDFFDLFCTVDKVGTRKALKALVRPVREVADAIQRQDVKWLTTLPGVGGPTAEKIIATLKKKVARFALAPAPTTRVQENSDEPTPTVVIGGDVLDEAYAALVALGQNPIEARVRLDNLIATGKTFASTEEVIREIYSK
jgi:holliday junction DNA helicase RuvA